MIRQIILRWFLRPRLCPLCCGEHSRKEHHLRNAMLDNPEGRRLRALTFEELQAELCPEPPSQPGMFGRPGLPGRGPMR